MTIGSQVERNLLHVAVHVKRKGESDCTWWWRSSPEFSAQIFVVFPSKQNPNPRESVLFVQVSVQPTDSGIFPSSGELVAFTDEEIAIRRKDDKSGTVIVHFPRRRYEIIWSEVILTVER